LQHSHADFSIDGFAKDNLLGETTGGKGGPVTTVSSLSALRTALASTNPATIIAKGSFNLTDQPRLRLGSNKLLLSHKKAQSFYGGISAINRTNIIIRNVQIIFAYDNDCIASQNTTSAWIDHNVLFSDQTIQLFSGNKDNLRSSRIGYMEKTLQEVV
jgi:pectate lyase